MKSSPFLRQLLVAGMPQLAAMSVGGAVGYPSVLLAQLSTRESSIQLDLDTTSWIGSIHGLAGIPSILMPTLMQWKSRKLAFIGACFISIVGWILVFTATSSVAILISESFHGLGTNSLLVVSLLSMSEMVNPQFRNVSMISFHIMQAFGMALVGIVGRYLHWKIVSLIMGVPVTIAMFMGFLWPESPSWLACKGRFEKCEEAFVWLRGTADVPKKELQDLTAAQKENLFSNKQNERSQSKHFWNTLKSKDFYVPSLHIFVLLNLMYWSGSAVSLIYSIQMIQQATHNESAAFFGVIIMNSILFVCVVIGACLIRRFNNKPVLLISTLGTALSLVSTSAVNYSQTVGWISKYSLICLYLLIAFIIVTGLGMMPIVFVIAAELMPVKHRGIGGVLYIIYTCILHSSSLKLAPYLFVSINLWGTLLLFGCNASICGLFIWKFVPETKGRTLQEIEDFYVFGSFKKRGPEREPQEMHVWIKD